MKDSFHRGIEPGLVDVRRVGDYDYNNVAGDVGYSFSRRWIARAGGGWDYVRYDDTVVAASNDHDTYNGWASMLYAIDPRTSVGIGYRYQQTTYSSNDVFRGSESQIPYLSFVRHFNPK